MQEFKMGLEIRKLWLFEYVKMAVMDAAIL